MVSEGVITVGEDEPWMVETAQVVMVLVLFSCFVCVIVLEKEREKKSRGIM